MERGYSEVITMEGHDTSCPFCFLLCIVHGERTDKTLGSLSNCSLSNVINSVPNRKATAA